MRSSLRRALALTTAVTLLAGLAIITTAAPAAAQPTCDGKLVTITDNDGNDQDNTVGEIEGTNGNDVILGTDGDDLIYGLGGNDRICGGLGNDHILGGDGNDRLFGGSGDDQIAGLLGDDALFGFTGDDTLTGGNGRDLVKGGGGADIIRGNGQNDILQGNAGPDWIRGGSGLDRIDGGPATDDCAQGPRIRRCERADLSIRVLGPSDHGPGTVTFKVRVKNRGPQAASYSYALDEENNEATCNGPQPWEMTHSFGTLRPGASRTRSYDVTCTVNDVGAWVEVTATLFNDARDPRSGNNKHKRRTNLHQ